MAHVLLIADIHANYPALSAVFEHCPPDEFDYVFNAGDTLVFGPYPNESLMEISRHKNLISVLGNTDQEVLDIIEGGILTEQRNRVEIDIFKWTAENLTDESLKFLKSLKREERISIDNLNILICHGSPGRFTEFLYPYTSDAKFSEALGRCEESIIVSGHTHIPLFKKVENKIFINPGSVGRPLDNIPKASYATLDTYKFSDPSISFHRVDYPKHELVERIRIEGFPSIYETIFLEGKKFD